MPAFSATMSMSASVVGVDLRGAEAAVGGVEGVVGGAAAAQCLEVGDVVAVEADRRQVDEDGHEAVGAVVEGHVVLGGDDLAVFVAGDAAVGEGGRRACRWCG